MSKKIILKVRDDKEPVKFEESQENQQEFTLVGGSQSSWGKENEKFSPKDLRSHIEPWLTALFQSEHFSLLAGAGLTYAVHSLATNKSISIPQPTFTDFQEMINKAAGTQNQKNGTARIEKQINVANNLLVGLEYLQESKEKINTLQGDISKFLMNFSNFILELERSLTASDKNEYAFNYLVSFLTSFASRSGTRDRLQIFTTNYDRVIETGAEVAGIHLLDRFVGNISPIFRSTRLNTDMHYNPPGIRGEPRYLEGVAHFSKLHGSIDWIYANKDIRRIGLSFGAKTVEPYLKDHGITENIFNQLMIYPNAAKDKETTSYPYVELFRDFAVSTCRPNSTLVSYGYSFGDDHINRVIEDMLTIPSTHLVIISYDDPEQNIMDFYNRLGRPAQTTLLIGEIFGNLESLVTHYLPKPAIDRITSRMTELLKSRLNVGQEKVKDATGNEEK